MKIVIIHTSYQQKGGEDTVVSQEKELLSSEYDVRLLRFQNKNGITGFFQFICSIWNPLPVFKVRRIIKDFKPDIIHIHNWHYATGPLMIRHARRLKIPVVVTLHNYRLLCPSAILYVNGKLFSDSLNRAFPWTAVKNKVYRNSFFLTFWLAFVNYFHFAIGTFKMVGAWIVLTDFAKEIFLSGRFENLRDRFYVKPNFIRDEDNEPLHKNDYFLFVGRLTEEKGVLTLIKAFEKNNYKLKIVGDGDLRERVQTLVAKKTTIEYLGSCPHEEVLELMQTCSALIFPSEWYEGMPMTIIEAFSRGAPVVAGNLGAMTSMIEHGVNGLHFKAGCVTALNAALDLWQGFSEEKRKTIAGNAKRSYKELYSPHKNSLQFNRIYKSVVRNS